VCQQWTSRNHVKYGNKAGMVKVYGFGFSDLELLITKKKQEGRKKIVLYIFSQNVFIDTINGWMTEKLQKIEFFND